MASARLDDDRVQVDDELGAVHAGPRRSVPAPRRAGTRVRARTTWSRAASTRGILEGREDPRPGWRPRARPAPIVGTRPSASAADPTLPAGRPRSTRRRRSVATRSAMSVSTAGVSRQRPMVAAKASSSTTVRTDHSDTLAATTDGTRTIASSAAMTVRAIDRVYAAPAGGCREDFSAGCLSKPVVVRTMCATPPSCGLSRPPMLRPKEDVARMIEQQPLVTEPMVPDADHGRVPDRRGRRQAPRADQGRDQPGHRAARLRLLRRVLRLPLRDDARGRPDAGGQGPRASGIKVYVDGQSVASCRARRSTTSTRSWAPASRSTTRTPSRPVAAARASAPRTTVARRRAARTDLSSRSLLLKPPGDRRLRRFRRPVPRSRSVPSGHGRVGRVRPR